MITTQPTVAAYAGTGFTSAHVGAGQRASEAPCVRLIVAPSMSLQQENSVLEQARVTVSAMKNRTDNGKFALPRISTTRTAALIFDRDAALGGAAVTEVPGIRSCRIPV